MSDTDVITAKAQRWALIASENRAALEEVARLASQYPKDFILADMGKRARSGLHALAMEEARPVLDSAYGSVGTWGPNGHGPKIRQMLASARFHAASLGAKLGRAA